MLEPGEFCRIRVIFTPVATGTRDGEILVADDVGRTFAAQLTGRGVAAIAALSTASVGLGDVTVDTTSPPQAIRLTNLGDGPLVVYQIQVDGDFLLAAAQSLPIVLAKGESAVTDGRFAPRSPGQHANGCASS